jgi:hypothetical protein
MNARIVSRLVAVVVSLAAAATLTFGQDTVRGRIDSIDRGRIKVAGVTAQVTKETELLTTSGERFTAAELVPGLTVEMSVVDGLNGAEAASIIAEVAR